MNMDYGQIFSRAWNITWKHKILWLFGFLAMLLSGSSGGNFNFQYNLNRSDYTSSAVRLPPELQNIANQMNAIDWNTAAVYLGVLLGCLLLLWIVCFVLSILGRGGLIGGILKADSEGAVTLRQAWELGRRFFWRLLIVAVLEFLSLLAMGLVFVLPTILLAIFTFGIGLLCALPFLCVLLPAASSLISIFMYFVRLSIVIEDLDFGAAFRRAYQVLRDNIGRVILIGLVMLVVGFGSFLLTLALSFPVIGLLYGGLLWPLLANTGALNMTLIYSAIVLVIILAPILWLIGAILETWRTSVYTLAYKQFIRPPAESPAGTI